MRLRKRRVQEGEGGSTGIDLAPMLDFVTNLLIFFIITAVFVKESGVVVQRPTSFEQQEETENKSINIQITDAGEIYVDNRVIDVRAVRANVERMSAINSEAGVLIIASERAPTGVVIEVVDQVHLGGVYNVTFSTN
jgi:biopolymer transport protein ExbD